jgi:hypothetical protein
MHNSRGRQRQQSHLRLEDGGRGARRAKPTHHSPDGRQVPGALRGGLRLVVPPLLGPLQGGKPAGDIVRGASH